MLAGLSVVSGDGGSGGVGAVGVVAGAGVVVGAAVAAVAASDLLLESHSAAYVWSGVLQARPVSSIQPRVVEPMAAERRLVRWAGHPVGPDIAQPKEANRSSRRAEAFISLNSPQNTESRNASGIDFRW